MEKDNLKETLNKTGRKTKNLVKNFIQTIGNLIDNLIYKINKIDDYSNLKSRILSGVIMLAIGVSAIYFSKGLFFLLVISLAILMAFEWIDITKTAPKSEKQKWHLIGFLYILFPLYAALELREYGSDILFWMFAIIVATDTFAYFAGKNLGGPKLMPSVSPNKTWSGLAGGVVASIIIGFLSSFMFAGSAIFFIFISAILSILSQVSDLMESKVKRIFGVKDSGSIIPGHGGILDRFDAMVLVAPVTLILVWIYSAEFISK
ncbi:MAG: CDP-diglyceride synthetase [Myxococcota bacterium]|jgi:CDP-diglyceride synthetase